MSNYNFRPRSEKSTATPNTATTSNAFSAKIRQQKSRILVRYSAPPPPRRVRRYSKYKNTKAKKEMNHETKANEDRNIKKKKKEYKEPTNIRDVYWCPPQRKADDYETEVSWYGLPRTYGYSISKLLNDDCKELAHECQMRHQEYAGFSRWFISKAIKYDQLLHEGDIIYDKGDHKYYVVSLLPSENQLYVWPGYDNYFVAYGYAMNPWVRLKTNTDGIDTSKHYELFSNEIQSVEQDKLAVFYMKQNAKNEFIHVIYDKLTKQFNKKTKAKRLRFYETVMSSCWDNYLKDTLEENNVDVEDRTNVKKWTLTLDEAQRIFGTKLWQKVFGKKKVYVDDIDFILHSNVNKLRIYSVIFTKNTETGAISGNDLSKKD